MPLTDTAVRNAKPGIRPDGRPTEKPYKLTDGKGLHLEVAPAGGKWWRLQYRFEGRQKRLSLGVYPDVSLKAARERRDEARKLLAAGIDPSAQRKADKRARRVAAANSFEAIAREWHGVQKPRWAPQHAAQVLQSFEVDVFPVLGGRPISEIAAPEGLDLLRQIADRGAPDLAGRIRQRCDAVARYAIQTGRATYNPFTDLRGAVKAPPKQPRAMLPIAELPEFLRRLEAYDGHVLTRLAMKLCILTMTRTIEVIGARWAEFDRERKVWEVPAERMKMRRPHLVPLSDQALAVLDDLHPLSGHRELLFPGERDPRRPMSNNTMLFALYRLGYHGRATMHGFRSVASTVLNETGRFNPDAIERQLAHGEADKVRAAYHRAEYLDERGRMVQWWADHLDRLRADGNVVPLRRPAASG